MSSSIPNSPIFVPQAVVPDYKNALIGYLKHSPLYTEVVSPDHIRSQVTDVTGEPSNWLALVATGGWGSREGYPMCHAFVTAHCYGSTGYEAMRNWRTLKSVLQDPLRRNGGLVYNGVIFYDVLVGMPNELIDPGEQPWPKRFCALEVLFCEVPFL